MTVRNTCVAHGTVTGTISALAYTVPAQSAFILKSALLRNTGAAATVATVFFIDVPSGDEAFVWQGSIAAGGWYNWSGWCVANAGHDVEVDAGGGTIKYWLSGATLPYATPS